MACARGPQSAFRHSVCKDVMTSPRAKWLLTDPHGCRLPPQQVAVAWLRQYCPVVQQPAPHVSPGLQHCPLIGSQAAAVEQTCSREVSRHQEMHPFKYGASTQVHAVLLVVACAWSIALPIQS